MPASTGRVSSSAPALTSEAKENGGASSRPMPGARWVMTGRADAGRADHQRGQDKTMNETRKTSTASAIATAGAAVGQVRHRPSRRR